MTTEENQTEDIRRELVVSGKIPKTDKYLPASVLKQLYEIIDNPRDRAYIMYHAETGLRVNDVLQSEWVHVDWQQNRTYTYDHKKNSWRYVYWPEKVKPALKMWLKEMQIKDIKSKTLFNFTDKQANRILRKWLTRAEFRYAQVAGTHWLRHTFVRLSRKAGRDIVLVRQNTGDTYKTLLEWYEGLNSEDIREQMEVRPLV